MHEDLLSYAIDYGLNLGASYVEARYHRIEVFEIVARNGQLVAAGTSVREGVAVRTIYQGALAFSSTPILSRESIGEAVERAVSRAKPLAGRASHGLSQERLGRARVEVRVRKSFDSKPVDEKIGFIVRELWEEAKGALREAKLVSFTVSYRETIEAKHIMTGDGADVESVTPRPLAEILITIQHPQKGSMQRFIELGGTGGLEIVEEWKLVDLVVDELKRMENVLLKGTEPPKDPIPVVLGSEVVGLVVHESAGHPMEADRIWGREAAQAGMSFVKPEMIGRERIGNENATVIDDPTIPGSNGFYLYDDEGVPARPRYIYLKGLINEPLHNRWSAYVFGTHSNAASRAMDFESEPIVRMANTYLEPGDRRFEELLEEARNGVYVRSYMEWNIDDVRWGQRYVGLEAYMIRDGELAEPVRNPVLEFTTKTFYSSIVAKGRELRFYAGTCGKGEPAQGVPVWFGGPDVLLKPLRLGVAPS